LQGLRDQDVRADSTADEVFALRREGRPAYRSVTAWAEVMTALSVWGGCPHWVDCGHCESSRPLDSLTLSSGRGVMCNLYTATKSAAEVAALFRAQFLYPSTSRATFYPAVLEW